MNPRSYRIRYLILVLAAAPGLIPNCPAQERASLDLTKIAARVDLRRPEATSPVTGGYSGTQETTPCFDSIHKIGALHTSLVSLDRTHYQIEDEPTFEVTIENNGSTPVKIPFSPHLTDVQPKNPAQKFSYFELQITLWIAASERWRTNTGGSVMLYGSNDHANTMLTLKPGERVRVIGKGHLALDEDLVKLALSGHPADYVYAQASLYHQETLATPTQSATVSREVCIVQTRGQSVSIQLAFPSP